MNRYTTLKVATEVRDMIDLLKKSLGLGSMEDVVVLGVKLLKKLAPYLNVRYLLIDEGADIDITQLFFNYVATQVADLICSYASRVLGDMSSFREVTGCEHVGECVEKFRDYLAASRTVSEFVERLRDLLTLIGQPAEHYDSAVTRTFLFHLNNVLRPLDISVDIYINGRTMRWRISYAHDITMYAPALQG